MRLTHIITSLDTGGAEIMLVKLAAQLRGRYEQQVISLLPSGPIAPKLEALGVPVTSLELDARRPNPLAVATLVRCLRQSRAEVVQTWMYHADLLGGAAAWFAGRHVTWGVRNGTPPARAFGVPVIWGLHHGTPLAGPARGVPAAGAAGVGQAYDCLSPRTALVVRTCARLSPWLPKRIVCCSQSAAERHVALGYDARKLVVIPNGFDVQRFRPDTARRADVRDELGLARNTPLVGLIARFHEQKDLPTFFKAVATLHGQRPDVHFLVAGRGLDDGNQALARMRRDSGVGDVVHLLGERSDVPRLMAGLDLATLTSRDEAFPNVLGEAMACGVPCVATDVGDCRLILGDTGKVLPTCDAGGIADAWLQLLSLGDEAKAALNVAARERVTTRFAIDVVADRYAAVYAEVAAAAGASSPRCSALGTGSPRSR